MDDSRKPVEDRPVEVINTGEELLLRAKVVARQIEERVWRAMEGHGLPSPHTPEHKRLGPVPGGPRRGLGPAGGDE